MKKIIFSLMGIAFFISAFSQEMEWVKQLDQTSSETGQVRVYDIAKDASGNVFITGTFEGVVDFNPSAVGGELTSYYGSWFSEDPYIAKFDANGNYLWAQHIISLQGLGAGNSLVVDASGNVYVSGNQYVTGLDSFIARYTAAGTLSYLYYVKGYNSTSGAGELALDASGNLYYFNRFEGTNVDLDPTAGTTLKTSAGNYDAFITKFTASTGAFQWVKTFGGTGFEECYDIETDGTYLYVTGGYANTADFNPDAGVNNLTAVGNYDIYVASYLCSTGAYNYAYSFGGAEYERGYNLEVSGNNLYFATQYTGTIDFQQGAGTYDLTSASGGTASSIALLLMNKSTLAVSWGYNMPFNVQRPSMSVYGTGILVSSTVPTGTFDFDPSTGTHNITSVGWTGAVLCLESDQSFQWAVRSCVPGSASYYKTVETDLTTGFFMGTDFSVSVNVDPDGNATNLTPGSYGDDGFISHWISCEPVAITSQPSPASATICQGNTQTYSVTCSGTAPITYQWYDGGGAISGATSSSYAASASGSYYCIVSNDCGTETSNTVTLTVTPYPTNDNCANAISIATLPYNSGVMSNNCATNDTPAGSGCSGFGANVWFTFTGTGNRVQITTDNAGTNFDTEIHIYTGACGALTEVTCDDDNGSGTTSLAYICTTAATTYYVSVGYYSSSLVYGNYQLSITDYPIGTPTGISASPDPICPSSSSTLSATPGTNGEQVHWYTSSCGGTYVGTGNSISVSPASTTTYYARTYDTDCSMYSSSCASVTVTVYTNVSITSATAAASPICSSATTQITANGVAGSGATLTWWTGTGGTGTNLGSSNPLTVGPGTYYARVTGTCGSPVEASVTVASYINVSITSATAAASPICSSATTQITANGVAGTGATLTWWTGTGGTGTNLGSSNPLTVGPGTYYARVTGTCGSPVEASVTVASYTNVSITSATAAASPICSSATTQITANGIAGTGATLTWWTGTGGTGTNLGSSNPLTVGPGTYYARVTGTCGSPVEASVTVASYTNVSITSATAAASPICSSATTQITANGVAGTGATLTWWTGTGGTGTNLGSSNPLTVGPGTYYARVTGTCGSPVEASVTVASYTNVSITSATAAASPICSSATTQITANGIAGTGATLTWWTGTGGTGTNLGSSNPLTVGPGTYYARVTGTCGSPVEASVTVASYTNVSITSATAAASPICSSATTQITANGVAGTGATLTWWTGTGGTGTNLGSSNPLTVGPGTYYARVTGTCGSPVEASVTVASYTSVSITSATAAASPICSSATTQITANGVAGTGATLTWWTGTGGTGTNLGSSNPLTVGPGTYYARVTGTCGSPVEASVTVISDPLPIASAGGSVIACVSDLVTVLGASASNGTILWTHDGAGSLSGETTLSPVYTPAAGDIGNTVTLTITVTSNNTCGSATDIDTYQITIGTTPAAPTSGFSDINNFCENHAGNINLIVAGGSGGTVHWYADNCNGPEIGTGNPLTIESPSVTTTYFARYENSCGFSDCFSIPVNVVVPPVEPLKAESDINNICADHSGNIILSIDGGSGETVEWFTGSCGGSSIGSGDPLVIPSPEITTIYFARWENACGASACAVHEVTVLPLAVAPTTALTNLNNFCSNDAGDIELSAIGGSGDNLNWYTESCGGTLVGTGNPLAIESPETNTTYFARWENSCGASSCEFIAVNVIEEPVAPISISSSGNNLCTNDAGTISLTAVGGSGTTLRWFEATCAGTEIGTGNPLIINSPETSTDYFARWENSCGVSNCSSITINIIDAPADPTSATVDISSVCISDAGNIELSLNGGAGPIVEWYSGSCGTIPVGTGNPLTIESPMVTTTYFGRYESSCGNSNCQSVTVTVTDLPQPPASAQSDRDNFCSSDDGNIELSVTGGSGTDVHWFTTSCGDTEIGIGNPLVIESPESTTTYFGRWENPCGVTVCQNVTVSVIQSADATINPAGPLCETGDPIVMTAAQIGGTWSGTSIDPVTGLFDPEVAGPGDFDITYTITGTCGDSDDFTISVIELFDATITDVDPMCSNEPAFDLVAATTGGTWSGLGITNSLNGTFNPTVAGAGNHIITYEYTGLCGNSDQTTITVLQKANATINAAGPFCITDDPVVITAVQSGGTWSGTAINPTTGLFDPETAGVGDHIITYSISGDCGDTQNTMITVLPLFDATTTEVSAMCTADAAITLTAATAGGTWSGTGITDSENGTFDPSVAGAGNHVITYTNSGICGSSDNITITVAPSADATITHVGPFCIDNDPIVLQAAQIGGTWSGTAVNPSNGFFDPEVAGAGEHVITYTITGSCGDSDEITIYILEYFDATITAPETICFADDTVYLSAADEGGIWYANGIDPNSGALSVDDAGPGILEVIYSYEGICPDSDTAYISILEFADASFTAPDTLFDNSEIVTLTPTNLGGIWTGNISDTSGLFSPQISGLGEFEVIYTIEGPCGDSDTATIIVIKSPVADLLVPTVITPDGDGFNDRWRIQGIEAYDEVSIKIFTRWGDEVFVYDGSGVQYADPANQWAGKRDDKELPSGGYIYLLILNGDEVYKGTISLIR